MTSLVCCNWMLLVPRISTGSTAILDLHEWIIQYTSMTTLHRFTPSLMTSMLVQARSQDRMMIHLLSPSSTFSHTTSYLSCFYPTSTSSLPQSILGWFLAANIDQDQLKAGGFAWRQSNNGFQPFRPVLKPFLTMELRWRWRSRAFDLVASSIQEVE